MSTGAAAHQILVVEDDPNYARALNALLSKAGYAVESAQSGRSAASLIGLNSYDLVLSDIQIPEGNGVQLMHLVKKIKADLPVVLMTSFVAENREDELLAMGAAGFLGKPFTAEQLLKLVERLVEPENADLANEPASTLTAADFCQISLDEFISGKTATLDLYVQLGSDSKFVKIARAGEDMPLERLNSYRRKNVEYFHVSREDYEKYISLQLRLAKAMREPGRIPEEKRRSFIKHANEVILQDIYARGVDERSFTHARNITESNLAILTRSETAFYLLDTLNASASHLLAHALGVSVYSSMLSKALGWKSPATLYKVSMGALFHDVGLKDLPRELLEKPFPTYNAEENRLYQQHPTRGLEVLKNIDDIPVEVLLIVSQHHETPRGCGFPSGLRGSQIFPLARLVGLVDDFCDLILKGPGVTPRAPAEALSLLAKVKGPLLDPKMLRALGLIFGIDLGETPTAGLQKGGNHGKKSHPH